MPKSADLFNLVGSCAIVLSALLIGCDAERENSGLLTPQTPAAPTNPPPCLIDCGGSGGGDLGGGSDSSEGENIDNTPKYQVSSASGNAPPELPTIYGR